MKNSDFMLAEYNQLYELVRHYAKVQHEFFKMFLTVYTAVCGGYLLITGENGNPGLADTLLLMGLIACACFIALISSNRAYFHINFRKIEFLRTKFLYSDPSMWKGYPMFYPDAQAGVVPREGYKSFRWSSAFFVRILIMCFAASGLFYLWEYPERSVFVVQWKLAFSAVFFVVILFISYKYSMWKERVILGDVTTKKERVESK